MSTRVTRNSSALYKNNYEKNTYEKNEIIELAATNSISKTMPFKMPIIAPNGKTLYPCQYCAKVFQRKITSLNHMKKCPNKNTSTIVSKYFNAPLDSHNSDDTPDSAEIEHNVDSGYLGHMDTEKIPDNDCSTSDNNNDNPSINICQNKPSKVLDFRIGDSLISLKAEKSREPNDISIYDYNEDGMTYSEVEAGNNDRKCKHCHEFFENPLDILRHSRTCHNVPRKFLPLDEVEKYFDSPNRNFCPICEKPIKTRNFRSVFVKHLLVHTVGLTHECNICKKKFRRRDHMRAHHKRHIVCG